MNWAKASRSASCAPGTAGAEGGLPLGSPSRSGPEGVTAWENSQASKGPASRACTAQPGLPPSPHPQAGTEFPAPRPNQRLVAVAGSWDRPQQVGTGLGRAGGGGGKGEAASRSPCARDSRWPLTSGVRARRGGLYVRVVLRFLGLCLQHLSGSGRGRRGSCGAAGPGALRHGPVFLPLRRSPFIIQSARSAPKAQCACAAPREREDPPHGSKACWELWSCVWREFYRRQRAAAEALDYNAQRCVRAVSRMVGVRDGFWEL